MKLLLHACCGPCAVYIMQEMMEENKAFDICYYNPNIHPLAEHARRGEALQQLADAKGLKVIYSTEFMQREWETFEGAVSERCEMCYRSRLEEVAIYAKRNGYDGFTTSLLISPYQDHELIKQLGEQVAEKYDIGFFYKDYRPFFRQGQQLARDAGVYRQKYCGCICSLNGNGR